MSRSLPVHDHLHEVHTVEDVLALVREHGGRVTNSRRLLLEALFHEPGHRSAEDLAETRPVHAPDVALSTVYRNLDELEKLGVVVHSHLGHGPATYHLASGAHCHFVCQDCGGSRRGPRRAVRGVGRCGPRAVRIRDRHPALRHLRTLRRLPEGDGT